MDEDEFLEGVAAWGLPMRDCSERAMLLVLRRLDRLWLTQILNIRRGCQLRAKISCVRSRRNIPLRSCSWRAVLLRRNKDLQCLGTVLLRCSPTKHYRPHSSSDCGKKKFIVFDFTVGDSTRWTARLAPVIISEQVVLKSDTMLVCLPSSLEDARVDFLAAVRSFVQIAQFALKAVMYRILAPFPGTSE